MSPERGRKRSLSSSLVRGLAIGAGLGAAAAARKWIDVVEVQGGSMAPTLLPGEWLIVERRSFARRPPRVGEIVLAVDPREPARELIKRVASVDLAAGSVELHGDDGAASTDSRAFGALPLSAIEWRVIARYWPARRLGRI